MEEEALAAAEELLEQLEASEARRRDLEQELLTTRKRNIDLEQDVQDLTESLHLAAERIAKEENMRTREELFSEASSSPPHPLSVVDENEDENNATDVESENEQRERCALLSDPLAASAQNDEDNDVTVDAVEVLCGDLWGERVRVDQKPEVDDFICRQVYVCGDAKSSTASRRHRLESLDTTEKALSTQGLHHSKIPPQAPPGTAVPWTPPASMSKNLAGGRPAGWLSQLDWDTES
ncbi:Hypothetical Protein FCC1311_072102 [Hondaea fermentalgiana]|uniref:Uncharacterized protein n=1 Tax=Hondaea fermentalgiana TaxID=2315210 RepID=A0A2R5GL07_9STRA|nr:Hypothetical Protein FCC1311_072102 [Hondaea fermentalgiana]|eukprot:GBG30989.1 Hypothetical Protein FCC1311_072102 [Hondaea fermentalgiana]